MALHSYDPPRDDEDGGTQPPAADGGAGKNAAADVIRDKLARIYNKEPSVTEEMNEAEQTTPRSKHQQFMHELSQSGKDLAAIQTEWHNYYQKLPPKEKHEVWHEFYASQPSLTEKPEIKDPATGAQALSGRKKEAAKPSRTDKPAKLRDARSKEQVQTAIRQKVTAGGKLQAKHQLQSLLFGLGVGALFLIIFLFGFFNELVITPFIQPGRTSADAPLIVNNTVSPTAQPEVIIPKINVEIPVDYSQTTTDENQIENALEDGVVHYPTTSLPGQNGNTAYFGHSSNNIFNKGKYKFAFVLLHTLQNGDLFYLTYNGKVYAYKVISKTIVPPSDVSVLGPVAGQSATATLITCDPPGTSINRLIVVGQQISPDPATNTAASAPAATTGSASNLPGNGPTLWSRVTRTAPGKAAVIVVLGGIFGLTAWWVFKPRRMRPA